MLPTPDKNFVPKPKWQRAARVLSIADFCPVALQYAKYCVISSPLPGAASVSIMIHLKSQSIRRRLVFIFNRWMMRKNMFIARVLFYRREINNMGDYIAYRFKKIVFFATRVLIRKNCHELTKGLRLRNASIFSFALWLVDKQPSFLLKIHRLCFGKALLELDPACQWADKVCRELISWRLRSLCCDWCICCGGEPCIKIGNSTLDCHCRLEVCKTKIVRFSDCV